MVQATLFEPRLGGVSCVAWTAEKNGKPKKDLRLPFSLLRFFWASKRNEEKTFRKDHDRSGIRETIE